MKTVNLKLLLFISLFLILILSGCAQNEVVTCLNGHTYGFWGGLWHGLIAPFDFIGMLFTDHIVMYAPNNNGAWYAFGFLLGSGGWGVWGTMGSKTHKRYKNEYGTYTDEE